MFDIVWFILLAVPIVIHLLTIQAVDLDIKMFNAFSHTLTHSVYICMHIYISRSIETSCLIIIIIIIIFFFKIILLLLLFIIIHHPSSSSYFVSLPIFTLDYEANYEECTIK